MDALDTNGSPKPEFETDDERSYFITRLFIHEMFSKKEEKKENAKTSEVFVDETIETSFETSLKQVLKQRDYEKLKPVIVKLARGKEISIQEVMELTKKSRTTAWRYMHILIDYGVVEMTGNTNQVSYRRSLCDGAREEEQ